MEGPLLLQDVIHAMSQDLVLQKVSHWAQQGGAAQLGKRYDTLEIKIYCAKRHQITLTKGCLWKGYCVILPRNLRLPYMKIHNQQSERKRLYN